MNRFKIIKSLLMNVSVSLTMSVVAQLVNIALGHAAGFSWRGMAISFLFSYFVAFWIAYFVPTDRWGFAFAEKCGAQCGTWRFDVLVNLVVNSVFCIIMTAVMHWFNACLLGGMPLSTLPMGFAQMILPVWITCFAVSLLTQRPALRMAKKLCGMER